MPPNPEDPALSVLQGSITLAPLMPLHHDDDTLRVSLRTGPATSHSPLLPQPQPFLHHNQMCMEGERGTGAGQQGQCRMGLHRAGAKSLEGREEGWLATGGRASSHHQALS